MNKLPLSVSSKLTTINTPLSLTVSSYANETGKTGSEAPVLIAIEAKRTLFADDFAAALPEKGGQGTPEQARLVVNAVASVLQDLVAQYGAITVNTPIGTVETFIAGSLENATDAIDPDVNIPFLGVVAPPELMKQFAAIQTFVPTSECPAALKRICDKATGVHEIHGTSAFYAQGYGMSFGATGETMKLLNPLTRAEVTSVNVDAASKSEAQLTCTLPSTKAIAAGEYILQLLTLAGGGALGGTLWPLELKVKLTEPVVPTPAITKIKEGVRPDNNVGFGSDSTVLTGVFPGGHKTGDVLRLDSIYDGGVVNATMTLDAFVTASNETTITLGNGFANESESPDSEWNGHTAKVTLVRAGTEYSHTFAFSAA